MPVWLLGLLWCQRLIYTFEEQKAAERVNPDTTLVGDDKKFITGIMCIVVAIPFTAAGTALSVIGGRKRGEYKRRLYIRGLTMSLSGRKVSFTLPVDF